MAIETGLRTLLLGQTGITSLVPAQTVGSVNYPGIFNEDPAQGFVPPFILISQTDFDAYLRLDNTIGTKATDFDIDCYSYSFPASLTIAKAVSDFLMDFTGAAGPLDTIRAVLWEGKRSDKLFDNQGNDTRQRIVSLSFKIQHS